MNSNNVSREYSYNNIIHINTLNPENLSKNNSIINKPIIKEKNDSPYGLNTFSSGKNHKNFLVLN